MRPPPAAGCGPVYLPSWASELALAKLLKMSCAVCLLFGSPPQAYTSTSTISHPDKEKQHESIPTPWLSTLQGRLTAAALVSRHDASLTTLSGGTDSTLEVVSVCRADRQGGFDLIIIITVTKADQKLAWQRCKQCCTLSEQHLAGSIRCFNTVDCYYQMVHNTSLTAFKSCLNSVYGNNQTLLHNLASTSLMSCCLSC